MKNGIKDRAKNEVLKTLEETIIEKQSLLGQMVRTTKEIEKINNSTDLTDWKKGECVEECEFSLKMDELTLAAFDKKIHTLKNMLIFDSVK